MSFALTALIMFAFWIILSGEFSFVLLFSGIISSLMVSYMSHDLLIKKVDTKIGLIKAIRFFRFLPWLLWQILLANIDLALRILNPNMPINPRMIKFKNNLIKKNYNVIDFADFINTFEDRENKNLVLSDGHFSPRAYRLLAKFLSKKLKL